MKRMIWSNTENEDAPIKGEKENEKKAELKMGESNIAGGRG